MSQEGGIDIRVVIRRLWARRRLIAACVVLATAVFSAAAFLMTPIYRATTLALSAGSDRSGMGSIGAAIGQLGGLASLAGMSLGTVDTQTQEALAVLRSREFTEFFIRERQLMPVLFAQKWDAKTNGWRGPRENWPTFAQAFKKFDTDIRSVNRDRTTGLITLTIEWRDPEEAADWANDIMMRLNAEMRSRAIASGNASINFLEKELNVTQVIETRQAINRLMEVQINQRMLANVTRDYALRIVDRALAPDRTDVVRPNRLILFVMGPTLGLLVGAFLALLTSTLATREQQTYKRE